MPDLVDFQEMRRKAETKAAIEAFCQKTARSPTMLIDGKEVFITDIRDGRLHWESGSIPVPDLLPFAAMHKYIDPKKKIEIEFPRCKCYAQYPKLPCKYHK